MAVDEDRSLVVRLSRPFYACNLLFEGASERMDEGGICGMHWYVIGVGIIGGDLH